MIRQSAFVLAHYHPEGLLDWSTRGLINYLGCNAARVVLVSTNLKTSEHCHIPGNVMTITRDNQGYDFSSYKEGLAALKHPGDHTYTCLLNSSFVSFNPEKLMSVFSGQLAQADVIGLTRSSEHSPHLQSYFIIFSRKAILSNHLTTWWNNVVPISDRQSVIENYEIGLSTHLLANGFSLASVYEPTTRARLHALCHAVRIGLYRPEINPVSNQATIDLAVADFLNPTHFMWEEILEKYGIVKRELYVKNPFRLDIASLYDKYKLDR